MPADRLGRCGHCMVHMVERPCAGMDRHRRLSTDSARTLQLSATLRPRTLSRWMGTRLAQWGREGANPPERLDLVFMDTFPSEKLQIDSFEPCRRRRADHVVRDDGLLCDERCILRLQHSKPTGLFDQCMA